MQYDTVMDYMLGPGSIVVQALTLSRDPGYALDRTLPRLFPMFSGPVDVL